MRSENHVIHKVNRTTTTSHQPVHLPKHFSVFEQMGWALKTHNSLSPEVGVRRIQSVSGPNGFKMSPPFQYSAASQVREVHTDI